MFFAWRAWLRKWLSWVTRSKNGYRPRVRLKLHTLEERTVPASFPLLGSDSVSDPVISASVPSTFTGGVRVAAGDVTGDGYTDIVAGQGPGGNSQVKVISGRTGTELAAFFPYGAEFAGGVYVATGDVNGDGIAEVITGTGNGGGPLVKVFDGSTGVELSSFFPYEESFRGGVIVAAGDTDGDGLAEVITGTGVGGGPRILVTDVTTGRVEANFFAYEDGFRGGVLVGAGDTDGDGLAEVITGTGVGGGPRVQIVDPATGAVRVNFFAYEDEFRGGVLVGAADIDGDGRAEVLTGTGVGGGPVVTAFAADATQVAAFLAYEAGFRGGVSVAGIDLTGDGKAEIVTGSGQGGIGRLGIFSLDGTVFLPAFTPFDPVALPGRGFSSLAPASPPVGPPTVPAVAPPRDARYVSFNGEASTLQAWEGERVAFLTARRDLDPAVMGRIVRTFDRAYDWYKAATGREPTPNGPTTYNGKATIAVVTETCGAGCGFLGNTGIEILPEYFDRLYDGVRLRNQYDHVLFYELGRNFWFFGSQLEYRGADDTGTVTTGYAVLMRFLAMEAVGVAGGPFNGWPFGEWRREAEGLVDRYVGDPSLNWGNTLRAGAAPAHPMNFGATDLFASFVLRLRRDYGGETFLRNLWREAGLLPEARTTQEASDNFILAASRAAGRDLGGLFAGTWRWPVSEATRDQLREWFPA